MIKLINYNAAFAWKPLRKKTWYKKTKKSKRLSRSVIASISSTASVWSNGYQRIWTLPNAQFASSRLMSWQEGQANNEYHVNM